MKRKMWQLAAAFATVAAACSSAEDGQSSVPTPVGVDGTVTVLVDQPLAEISPLIRGVSGDIEQFIDAGVTLNSWGGERATRYNYQLGNAWTLGRESAYRNEGDPTTDDLVGDWMAANSDAGVESRVAIPALGWVARNDVNTICSFPGDDESCLTAEGFDCESPGPIADPTRANVGSSPASVGEWIGGYADNDLAPAFLAVDNEPERWGVDHYDVHPTCTDYFEIFGTYAAYASQLRRVAPTAQLTGPVMCCWFGYRDASEPADPGPGDGSDSSLLPWFLDKLLERQQSADTGTADADGLIDVVDVHFRPTADVVNSRADSAVAAERIEATRELWDPAGLVDGFDPDDRSDVQFTTRLRATIDETHPGLPLMISDWRFGGETSSSGAIAIAETLGIFAREGVFAAAHADTLQPDTPGWFAFKMFGNYDGKGGAFEGIAVEADLGRLEGIDAFAAVDGRTLRVLVINTSAEAGQKITVDLGDVASSGTRLFTYAPDASAPAGAAETATGPIAASTVSDGASGIIELPASSISMIEFQLATELDLEVPVDEP